VERGGEIGRKCGEGGRKRRVGEDRLMKWGGLAERKDWKGGGGRCGRRGKRRDGKGGKAETKVERGKEAGGGGGTGVVFGRDRG